MATIIDCGNGRYIAGDPLTELAGNQHWCPDCGGSGLQYGYDSDFDLDICSSCYGAGAISCEGVGCLTCEDEAARRRRDRLDQLGDLLLEKILAAEWADHERRYNRYKAFLAATETRRNA